MSEVLYRFFDKENRLLYVGISNNWQERLKQHYKHSNFHELTTYVTFTHYETRAEVESAELKAILSENPRFNKALNPNWENVTQHMTKIKRWVYSNELPDDQHIGIVTELKKIFMADPLWTRKSMGPIAYYYIERLGDWHNLYGFECDMCPSAFDSNAVNHWAQPFRQMRRNYYATN